ncbi:bifunctional folylpolyglutamate synthase/dihydrofolate synthase [Alicyclobacillus cycloheptanicus]|uniref:tetrahydrofolate synthase n=1 Tax=Alicyclobacillus cycloheptanicus TaxID=1457 RepID=A0ABT9XG00_9BACL|nr:bifunctional folylpolyglutamate synthase/dihydrofolate synthase [Alicyclobacillus cycloheptanicus]MDQ0189224.1 dihydrofolate synthase/folylpolyglutamate synthase [Alicyclobacillus cycloheptanicus]WDM00408.1 bifunctional folylpolyglutamate synthase/dihydrofolate synthase [Alicyclobacillus cycloheptanicus]
MTDFDRLVYDTISLAYRSFNRVKGRIAGKPDREVRHPEWTRRLLDEFGKPDDGALNVMVTGSKGKGSHATLLAGILQKLGFRVGLFTGPHLVDFMERFRVNGQPISEADFVRYMQAVAAAADALDVPAAQYIGPVGLLSVVAALWFRDEQTDVNVFECGRGALHDDVNQIVHQGAVVAPVFLEHVRELGPTLGDVAREKAGVVTTETRWVVSSAQLEEPMAALQAASRSVGAPLYVLHRDFAVHERPGEGHVEVTVRVADREGVLHIPRIAGYMTANAAVAWIAAQQVLAMHPKRRGTAPQARAAGAPTGLAPGCAAPNAASPVAVPLDLTGLRFPGRMQVVRSRPLTLVDGTIHAESAKYVRAWVEQCRPAKVGCIVGIPQEKDIAGVLAVLAPAVDFFIATKAQNPHLVFSHDWVRDSSARGLDVAATDRLEDAVHLADARLGANDVLLVVGTQSLVGEALAWFRAPTRRLWSDTPEGGARA